VVITPFKVIQESKASMCDSISVNITNLHLSRTAFQLSPRLCSIHQIIALHKRVPPVNALVSGNLFEYHHK